MSMMDSTTRATSVSVMVFVVLYKRHPNMKKEEWGVPLPDPTHNSSSLCAEDVLLPGHNVSTFLCQQNSSIFESVANIVSVVNLNKDCPSSLLQALASAHHDLEV